MPTFRREVLRKPARKAVLLWVTPEPKDACDCDWPAPSDWGSDFCGRCKAPVYDLGDVFYHEDGEERW